MTDILQAFLDHPNANVSITMGTEHWQKGETTLVVYGSGKAEIINKQAGKLTTYDGQLENAQIETLAQILLDADVANLRRSDGLRKPGDVPINIVLNDGDSSVIESQKLWYGDRSKLPHLNNIIMQYDVLVKELTNNALPY